MKKFLRRRGQAAVEFALLLPIFALILFSIIYTGFFVLDYVTLNAAAGSAARHAALNSSTYEIPGDDITNIKGTQLFLTWYALDDNSPKLIKNLADNPKSVTVMIQTKLTIDDNNILKDILPENYTVSKTANIED